MARPQDTKVGFLEWHGQSPFSSSFGGTPPVSPPALCWMVAPLGLEGVWQRREGESQGLDAGALGWSPSSVAPLGLLLRNRVAAVVTQVGP